MYFSSARLSSLAYTLFFASAQASYLQNELSFGHNDNRISPSLRAVPNFHLTGNPHPPEILSNRIVLTPPAPGNQRGAIWAENPLQHSVWTADIDFRATGPERGGGNMQIWYAMDGQDTVGTSSIYTVGKFEGLVLVIDQYAGSAGYIRGFLNDGTTDFKSHHSVDSLAFGHCPFAYRNLGRPSRIQIVHTASSLKVAVDSRTCFETEKIKLPLGYKFGVSAASAENPDSFELFKFITTTENHAPDIGDQNQSDNQYQNENQGGEAQAGQQSQGEAEPVQGQSPNDVPVQNHPSSPASAGQYQSSDAQFSDLQNRLQNMMKHISTLNRDFSEYSKKAQASNDDLLKVVRGLEDKMSELRNVKDKIEQVQRDVKQTKADLGKSFIRHVADLKGDVRETKSTISGMSSGIGKFVFIVLGSQAGVVGAYFYYKRRKMYSEKKYL